MKSLLSVYQSGDSLDWEIAKDLTELECVALIGLLEVLQPQLVKTINGDDFG